MLTSSSDRRARLLQREQSSLNMLSPDTREELSVLQNYREAKLLANTLMDDGNPTPSWMERPSFERTPLTSRRQPVFDTRGEYLSPIPRQDLAPSPPPYTVKREPASTYISPRKASHIAAITGNGNLQRALALEGRMERAINQADANSLTSKQVLLLESQIKDREDELECSKQSQIQLRSENLANEERIAKLEASMSVLEARLQASARREMALIAPPISSDPVPLQPPPPPVVVMEQDPKLLEELQHLSAQLEIAQEGRNGAEQSRVALERQIMELETRLEYAQASKTQLQERFNRLLQEYQSSQADEQALKEENERLRFALQEANENKHRQMERALASRNDYAARKVLATLRECLPDLDCLIGLVENEVKPKPNRILASDLLQERELIDGKSSPGEMDTLVALTSSIALRAKNAKMQVVERLALQEAKRIAAADGGAEREFKSRSRNLEDKSHSKCGVQ